MSDKRFPIHSAGFSIPWEMIEPFEAQAKENHDQTLTELARRGGMDQTETLCVLDGLSWRGARGLWTPAEANTELRRRLKEFDENSLRACLAAAEAKEVNAREAAVKLLARAMAAEAREADAYKVLAKQDHWLSFQSSLAVAIKAEARVKVLETACREVLALTGADQWGDQIDRVMSAALAEVKP